MNDVEAVAVGERKARAPKAREAPGESPVPMLGGPVQWLLGARFMASVKEALVATVFGNKLDAREWMQPEVVACGSPDQERFWFDYIADSGDSGRATFSVACLCHSDLVLEGPPTPGTPVSFAGSGPPAPGHTRLERGEFLFVGGDTAYHVANYDTLARQFQYPFNAAARRCNGSAVRRQIFAIPGNHDYYDALHGFNLQFRAPTDPDDGQYEVNEGPRLRLDGFVRQQQASYVALRLPHDWWFFGLDAQEGRLSTLNAKQAGTCRQLAFFKTIIQRHGVRKLIVATPEPSTAFGQRRRDLYAEAPDDDFLSATFRRLGLPLGFDADGRIDDGRCQLDLSGDVHQYARYWGPERESERDNYASVVSGLGGAFVHPTQVRRGDLEPKRLYPSPEECRKRTAELALPWVIAAGGWVWALGAVVAAIVYFALFLSQEGGKAAKLLDFFGHPAPHLDEPLTVPSVEAGLGMLPAAFAFLAICAVCGGLFGVARRAGARLAEKAEEAYTTTAERLRTRLLHLAPLVLLLGSLPFIVPYDMADFLLSTTLLVLVIGIPGGLCLAAWKHGGDGLGGARRLFLGTLGFVFGLSQIVVPVLAGLSGIRGVLAVAAVVLAFAFIGRALARLSGVAGKLSLVLGFVLLVALCIAAPLAFDLSAPSWGGFALAALTGLFFSCGMLGWYLLVSLAFDGHFNEVGGAARIAEFKQIVRLCIRKDAVVGSVLEAYVVAIDEPADTRTGIRAKLIDYFELCPRV